MGPEFAWLLQHVCNADRRGEQKRLSIGLGHPVSLDLAAVEAHGGIVAK
jgi:hypothetical protein